MSSCVRCHLPAGRHPVSAGEVFCLRHVPPAPLWMRLLTQVLRGRR